MERESFEFRKEWREALSGLPAEVRLEVYDAIVEYGISGRLSDLKPMARLAFSFVKSWIDGDVEREEHRRRVSLARSEAGKKGGAPKGNNNALKNKQIQAKTSKDGKEEKENKEETPPTPPKEEIKEKEEIYINNACVCASAYETFLSWLSENCPYLHRNLKLPTEAEFLKLKSYYGSDAIGGCCLEMENRRDLRKKYVSLYRTLLNWLKRRENGTDWNYYRRPSPAENIRAAEECAYRGLAAALVGRPKE